MPSDVVIVLERRNDHQQLRDDDDDDDDDDVFPSFQTLLHRLYVSFFNFSPLYFIVSSDTLSVPGLILFKLCTQSR